jgi:hypothetical protein
MFLGTELGALAFSIMCKFNDMFFFTFSIYCPKPEFNPISMSLHVGISLHFAMIHIGNYNANYISFKK